MASKNTELKQEQEKLKTEAFLKEYEAVTAPVIEKHSMRIIPRVVNLSNEIKVHYEAAFAVQRFTTEEVKLDKEINKENETLASKPEADKPANSND